MSGPAPSGVITITTDFGHQGPFVGVMKGRILGRFPQARIVDLTHEILVHWPAEAGFWLARAYRYFPRRHGARRGRRPGRGHRAQHPRGAGGGPPLPRARQRPARPGGRPRARCARSCASVPRSSARLGIQHPSATFHGRDIFAPVAAELAAGRARGREALGEAVTDARALLGGGARAWRRAASRASSSPSITSAT